MQTWSSGTVTPYGRRCRAPCPQTRGGWCGRGLVGACSFQLVVVSELLRLKHSSLGFGNELIVNGAEEAIGEALDRQLNFCRPSQAVQMDF